MVALLKKWRRLLAGWAGKKFGIDLYRYGTARYKKITGQTIANYDAMWKKIIDAKPVRNNSIPGAFVKWDNTPRHGDRGQVNVGTPEKFKYYLSKQIKHAKNDYHEDMIFMYAWNEWAEGGYLEPDEDDKYGYLGINPSGLLCNKKNEKTDLNTALSADYDQYVLELINCLKERNFDIYLIPHVGEDGVNSFSEIEGVNTHPEFSNPIEAKSFISSMDIFIGARMHATIAAFSSGVATIPTAYSRKFAGLYETLDYKYVVDLTRDNTSEALQQTMLYVDAYLELKKSSKYSMQKVKKIYDAMEDKIQKEMEKIVNNRRSK